MHTALTTSGTKELVQEVVDRVKEAVVGTMGPNGKLAFISVGTSAKVTKDGVSVAKAIRFEDPRQELVNRVITEPAIKTDTECGDGTTTTILLTAELYKLFCKHPGFKDQRFIEELVGEIIQRLKEKAITVTLDDERLYKLALTSSNSDAELSRIVTDIYRQSGERHPEIELKEGQLPTDQVVRSNGLPIKMYFSNPLFSKFKNGGETDFTNFFPIIIDANLGRGVGDLTTQIAELGAKYLATCKGQPVTILVIARNIEQDINTTMTRINEQTKQIKYVGIASNVGGSIGTSLMQDIATMFGAPLFQGIEEALIQEVPMCTATLSVNGSRSILKNISPETALALKERADDIATELGGYELGDRFSVRAKYNETRIRNLRGELVTVFVGGETYSDVKERIDRFEDVVKAVKSALVNGVLPGVGTSIAMAGAAILSAKLAELGFKETLDDKKTEIITELAAICFAQYNYLMGQTREEANPRNMVWNPVLVPVMNCVDLTTGNEGTCEELGVYDTAFAIITALKGGLQTAKILANANSLIISDKLASVMLKQ